MSDVIDLCSSDDGADSDDEDPELAMVLRVSMEEERARQERAWRQERADDEDSKPAAKDSNPDDGSDSDDDDPEFDMLIKRFTVSAVPSNNDSSDHSSDSLESELRPVTTTTTKLPPRSNAPKKKPPATKKYHDAESLPSAAKKKPPATKKKSPPTQESHQPLLLSNHSSSSNHSNREVIDLLNDDGDNAPIALDNARSVFRGLLNRAVSKRANSVSTAESKSGRAASQPVSKPFGRAIAPVSKPFGRAIAPTKRDSTAAESKSGLTVPHPIDASRTKRANPSPASRSASAKRSKIASQPVSKAFGDAIAPTKPDSTIAESKSGRTVPTVPHPIVRTKRANPSPALRSASAKKGKPPPAAPPEVLAMLDKAKNDYPDAKYWKALPPQNSEPIMKQCIAIWSTAENHPKNIRESIRKKFNKMANPELNQKHNAATSKRACEARAAETEEEKAERCSHQRNLPSYIAAHKRQKVARAAETEEEKAERRTHQRNLPSAIAHNERRRINRRKWKAENPKAHQALLAEQRRIFAEWRDNNELAYRAYRNKINEYARAMYREAMQEKTVALSKALGSESWDEVEVLVDLPQLPAGKLSWEGSKDLRENFGFVPMGHISDVKPEGGFDNASPADELFRFRVGNQPTGEWLPPNTIVNPSWSRNHPSWTHSRNGTRRRRSVGRIDASWWGCTLEQSLTFAEFNNGRGWVTQGKPLYLYICQPSNPMYWAIHPMGGGLLPWYNHSILPITPDSCYKLTPQADGTYLVTKLY